MERGPAREWGPRGQEIAGSLVREGFRRAHGDGVPELSLPSPGLFQPAGDDGGEHQATEQGFAVEPPAALEREVAGAEAAHDVVIFKERFLLDRPAHLGGSASREEVGHVVEAVRDRAVLPVHEAKAVLVEEHVVETVVAVDERQRFLDQVAEMVHQPEAVFLGQVPDLFGPYAGKEGEAARQTQQVGDLERRPDPRRELFVEAGRLQWFDAVPVLPVESGNLAHGPPRLLGSGAPNLVRRRQVAEILEHEYETVGAGVEVTVAERRSAEWRPGRQVAIESELAAIQTPAPAELSMSWLVARELHDDALGRSVALGEGQLAAEDLGHQPDALPDGFARQATDRRAVRPPPGDEGRPQPLRGQLAAGLGDPQAADSHSASYSSARCMSKSL